MTKLDQIIDAGFHADGFVTFEPKQLKKTIQKYAEYYAKQCLAIAAENAELEGDEGDSVWIDKESITNIKLPEHD